MEDVHIMGEQGEVQEKQEQLFWQKGFLLTENQCDSCRKHSDELKLCTRCWKAKYCNKMCQTAHWSVHKMKCKDHKSNGKNGNNIEDTETLATIEREKLGSWEVEISYGGEADLHKHCSKCKKNPGHHKFIPIDQFNVEHLPPSCQDNDIVDFVRAQADLTVRVSVKYVSGRRPDTFPKSNIPYPFSESRGNEMMRVGTGWVDSVMKHPNKLENINQICKCKECLTFPTTKTCKCKECLNSFAPKICKCKECLSSPAQKICICKECQKSSTPKTQFAEIHIYTATHVVFDHLEAVQTRCHLFFDRSNTPNVCSGVITLIEPLHVISDIKSDLCKLIYTTHDLDFAEKLEHMVNRYEYLLSSVINKYQSHDSQELTSSSRRKSSYDIVHENAPFFQQLDSVVSNYFPLISEFMGFSEEHPDFMEDRMFNFANSIRQTGGINDEDENLIPPSQTKECEELMTSWKHHLEQSSGTHIECDKQIPKFNADTTNSFDQVLHAIKFLSGVNLGDPQSYDEDAAIYAILSLGTPMPSYKHFIEMRDKIAASHGQTPQCFSESAFDFTKEVTLLSILNMESLQIPQQINNSARDVLKKILHSMKHISKHTRNRKLCLDDQTILSMFQSVLDAMDQLINLNTQDVEQNRNKYIEPDEQFVQSQLLSLNDALKDLMHLFKYAIIQMFAKNDESHDEDSLSVAESGANAMGKLIHVQKLLFDFVRHKYGEIEKMRSQPQGGSVDAYWRTLTIIVSHPHGCSKQVTIGHYTDLDVKYGILSRVSYTTPTCPGSSGARVCILGRNKFFHHAHSGNSHVNKELNFSAYVVPC